ncbi:class I SAM-dependent methyltransferase [Pseudochryseolinea flava]|uniref:Methyltransferase domain-containing protein n=1 Tax=Pseudochryseolinea flava TaxID=2059302 RepID=A0A364XXG2_9BACT|nr:class I SAM-dependent methyltransferase [Pseudochryseolinea flava]RAV98927.1 hypothetical protein DQQ10_21755 [Pseudochryseolinea flava]
MSIIFDSTKESWEAGYEAGDWNFIEEPIEKNRSAVIAMYCAHLRPQGQILDVGCGTGTLFQVLSTEQQSNYLGIDISAVAVARAKQKKNIRAIAVSAEDFTTDEKFDVIIFNEVLYYLDYQQTLQRYKDFLKPNGLIIISMYRIPEISERRQVAKLWRTTATLFQSLDEVTIIGKHQDAKITWDVRIYQLK